MSLQVLDSSAPLTDLLPAQIEQAIDVRVAVAFASLGGVRMIEAAVLRALAQGAHVEFMVGMDLSATDPSALWRLFELAQQHSALAFYCYVSSPGAIYHPKLYIMSTTSDTTAVVGSSNLTEGGLIHNIEVNLLVRARSAEEIVSDILGAYSHLKFRPGRVEPDEGLLEDYEALHRNRRRAESVAADHTQRELAERFQRKAEALRLRTPTRADLFGWLELVYDRLPDGEFSNHYVYAFRREFQEHYPENRNIEAKVRQQLQILCEMGLIEHVAAGLWRKR